VAQYLVGTPTFVEFRIINVDPDQRPIRLERFDVHIGDPLLEPGVLTPYLPASVPYGEHTGIVVDRKVDLGIDRVTSGNQTLRVEAAFSLGNETFALQGTMPVVFDLPGAQRIHTPHFADTIGELWENGHVPEGTRFDLDRFGECDQETPEVAYIRELKRTAGFRFLPFPLKFVQAEYATKTPTPAPEVVRPAAPARTGLECPTCETSLAEWGAFCHACGAKLGAAPAFIPAPEEPLAYCPHCGQHGPLQGPHRFCPHCGKSIPLYLEINEVALYMQEVSTFTEVQFRICHNLPVELLRFRVSLAGQELPEGGAYRVKPGYRFNPSHPTVRADRTVCPHLADPTRGSGGCPPGDNDLEIELEYESEGKLYSLVGSFPIFVLEKEAPPTTINNHFGNIIQQTSGEAGYVGGSLQDYRVDFQGIGRSETPAQFVRRLKKELGLRFKPVALYIDTITDLERERAWPRAPQWDPMPHARIWFDHNDVRHNYCLLAKPVLVFGRATENVDVRLYELEKCRVNVQQQAQRGIAPGERRSQSSISRHQWQVEPLPNGLRITQLSQSNVADASGGKKLGPNDSMLLGRNELIEIPNVIGLKYAANAPPIGGLEAAQAMASEIVLRGEGVLRGAQSGASATPWNGPLGGYRLDRLYSLTGEKVGDREDLKTVERYILVPGWVTVGSAADACIVVPDSAPKHAVLLHVNGYFFLMSLTEDSETTVAGNSICSGVPWPLAPGTEIRLGNATLTFDVFSQAYL
jgi:hypothetical protein